MSITPDAGVVPRVDSTTSSHRPIVLVTGASGKIGRVVVDLLVSRGLAVRALTSRPRSSSDEHVRWYEHDLRHGHVDLRGSLSGVAGVVHLAAELRDEHNMLRINADATRELAEAVERESVPFMCYLSSISVYGSPKSAHCSENSPVLSVERDRAHEYWASSALRAYGRTKLLGEYNIRRVARSTRYVIFRPTVVVDLADLRAIPGWNSLRRRMLSYRWTHHVYVKDVAEAILWAYERSREQTRPAAGPETFNLSNDDDAHPTFSSLFRYVRDAQPEAAPGRVLEAPPFLDWAKDAVRYRGVLHPRRTLGMTYFPPDKLYAAGYSHRYGMSTARIEAFGPADEKAHLGR